MWSTHERLYMLKSLANHIYAIRIITCKANDSQPVDEDVDDFFNVVAKLSMSNPEPC